MSGLLGRLNGWFDIHPHTESVDIVCGRLVHHNTITRTT